LRDGEGGGSRNGAFLSLKSLSVEGLWGGPLYWGPWKICYKRLRIQATLSIGDPLSQRGTWNQEWGVVYQGH